ncbi:MAG: extracellular solute-binding protein, partial [Firmicutes bacterium]|nr:extracellular solute-binding protein [Bacillota bacterium]
MLKRWVALSVVVSVLLGMLLLAGTAVAAAPVQLTFWPSSNPQEIEFAKMVVAEWNKLHPGIQVKMEPLPASRSTEEVLLAAIAARTTPDICANIYPGAITQYIAAKGLYPVDTFPDFYSFMEKRTPKQIIKAFTYRDGHVYQIPWKNNPVMMAYNVKLLKENGIDPDQLATYSGFLAAAKKFARDTNGDGKVDQWLYAPSTDVTWWQRFFDFYTLYIAASQGRTFFDNNGRLDVDTKAATEVFTFLQTLFRNGWAPKGNVGMGDPFLQGRIAVTMTGPYSIPYYEQNAPKGFQFSFRPVPVPDSVKGPVWTYGDPKNIGIFTTTKHPKEAWEFVKFILTKENDLLWLKTTSQPPYRMNIESDPLFAPYFQTHPVMKIFAAQSAYTRGV